ncbi:MAG TPA: response regulator [Ignavibacteriaceae bacterium]|nr:response regulator [Ignavibacteriaceae bacterium]
MSLLRILLVDDNNDFRNTALKFINSQIRFESLSWASDGEDALKMIEKFQPTLILMDSSIVEKNGKETIEIIRKLDRNAIIIFLTFDNEIKNQQQLLGNPDDFISKNEFLQHLIPTVEKIFGFNVNRNYA